MLANHQPSDPIRDTQASKAKAAEAAARKRKLKRTTAEQDPPQLPGQTTSLPAIPNTNGNKPEARSANLGGHVLERTTHGWWCTVCKVKSLSWDKLAPQGCKGNAPVTWSVKAFERAGASRTPHKKHVAVKSGPVFWCVACGAFAETAPKLLNQPCKGKHEGKCVAGGMRGQLKVLQSGRHPM